MAGQLLSRLRQLEKVAERPMKKTRARLQVLAGTALEVRSADAVEKQRVARERSGAVEQVGGAFLRMTRRVHRNQCRRAEGDPVAFNNASERIQRALLGRQRKINTLLLGEQPRPRKMIGVDVRIGYGHEPPSPLMKQPHVDVGIDRGVDDDRLGL